MPLAIGIAMTMLISAGAWACQVPVFRYALERWNPDRYQIVVLSKGQLSSEAEASLKPFTKVDAKDKECSVELTRLDLQASPDDQFQKLWKLHAKADTQSLLVALYPNRSSLRKQVAHVGSINADTVAGIMDSPVRQELVKRLTGGDSAVWLLVQSGDKEKDAAAQAALEKQLALDTQRIVLPTAEEMEVSKAVLEEAKIKLKISFSVLTIKRDDPKEKFLLDSLLNSEADLADFKDQPMAFPVFGRGIVLYALVGQGITGEVISTATSFIVGPCSCQVKEQNPGFDLLLNVDWDSAVGDKLVSVPVGTVETAPKLLTIPPGKNKK